MATVPARLVAGLAARRAADAGPLTVVSCDNLPDNGAVTARVVTELAALVSPELADWIRNSVSFVTTMVDRITPATTDDDVRSVAAQTGRADAAPVVTEPYAEWVLSGDFPADARAGRRPAPGSSRTSPRTSGASCGCSTAGTRCSRTPAGPSVTRRSSRLSLIRAAGAGWSSGGTRRPGTCRCPPTRSPHTGRR